MEKDNWCGKHDRIFEKIHEPVVDCPECFKAVFGKPSVVAGFCRAHGLQAVECAPAEYECLECRDEHVQMYQEFPGGDHGRV